MQTSTNRKAWTLQEDQTIKNLVSIYGIEDWTQISNKLKEEYPLSKRSGKQCRQRWYNHLSPVISKNPWTLEEEDKLFKLHREQGNKWKDISKQFIGRTDNDLKNHFYSTLRKSLRRLNKSLGQKNSTSQMRQIKPSVLSKIMHYIYDGQTESNLMDCLKDVPRLIFEFANIKPTKTGLSLKDEEMRDKVLRIFLLITQFNDQYQKGKNKKRERFSAQKQKVQKINRKKGKLSTESQSSLLNENQNSSSLPSSLENSIDSILDEDNYQIKQQQHGNDHTQISMGYSSVNSPLNHYFHLNHCQENEDYHSMFLPHKSGIFDDHDQVLQAQFHDPEEPSVINDYTFNQAIIGRNIFYKMADQHVYCSKIVDELLDGPHK